MERWCPRCEWLGERGRDDCPACGTPLLDVVEPAPPPVTSPEDPPLPAADPDPTSSFESDRRPGRRPIVWAAAALAVVVVVVAGVLGSPKGRLRAGGGTTDRTPGLPARLAYIAAPAGAGCCILSRLFVATEGAAGVPVTVVGAGAQAFAWAPDAVHSVLIDAVGALHVLPQDRAFPGPILGIAFSPDGTRVAVCSGRSWPPRITLLPIGSIDGQAGPSFEGCEPHWSADSTYLAYRLPSVPAPYGTYDDSGFGVLNTRLVARFSIPGSWPMAWAPAADRTFVPLTDVGADGRSIEIMDPRGGQRRVLLAARALRAIIGNLHVGPVDLLSWSDDGTRLAIGFGLGGPDSVGGVADVDPSTGEGRFVADRGAPTRISWSSRGSLLVGFGDHTRLLGASGSLSLAVRDATWSSDGRWILGRTEGGWTVASASAPLAARPIQGSVAWIVASWCCPADPGIDVGGTGL